MSFILDALKKAEADRKLGEAVSLHDPAPAPAPNWVEPASTSSHQSIWLMAVGAFAVCLAIGGWLWLSAPSPETAASTMPPQVTAPIARPDPSSSDTAMGVAAVTSPAMPEPASVQLPIPARPAPSVTVQQTPKADSDNTTAVSDNRPEPLPAAIRQQLPALTVSGAMYADVPANRMVVINGTVFHEGDTITPGLVLEHIALKAATLRYQGKAYLLAY
jgi:general secretion pathway protein B